MKHLALSRAHRLSLIDEQQDNQRDLRNLVDNTDRLQVKSVHDEIQNERRRGKDDQ